MAERWWERESTFDVAEEFALPDLQALLPKGSRLTSEDHQLEDTYLDTSDLSLTRFGVTLRRREGGPGAGWHLMAPDADTQLEISDSSDAATVPASLASLVVGLAAGEAVTPVAQLTVVRTTHQFLGRDGAVLVELADDRVQATTMGSEARLSQWREVDVALSSDTGRHLHVQLEKQLLAAGAWASASGSKLQRALGLPAAARTSPDLGSVGGLAWAYVAEQCRELVRCDIRLRQDEPLVHRFRVAIRRLRSTLRVFGSLFDADASASLEGDLVWLAGLLGEVRDREVLLERLAAQVRDLPAELVLGPVAAHIETTLLTERSEHRARLDEEMAGERYHALMRHVLLWQTRPPLTARADKPVASAERYLRRAEAKVSQRLQDAGGDVEALHGARKAAKRYRYAAELSARAGGKRVSRIVKSTTKLQTLLGEHQDSVVSATFLRRLGAEAGANTSQNGFTYGYLAALEDERARRIRDEANHRWGKKAK